MSDIYKGELQDNLGNTVYPHTESDVVFCADGETVQEKLTKQEDALGNVTGTTDSLEVSDKNILATSEATNALEKKFGNCAFSVQSDGAYVTYTPAGGADPVTKKLGSAEFKVVTSVSLSPSNGTNYRNASATTSIYDMDDNLIDSFSTSVSVDCGYPDRTGSNSATNTITI